MSHEGRPMIAPRFHRLLAVLLVAALAAAACGDDGDEGEATPVDDGTATTDAPVADPSDDDSDDATATTAEAEPVVLTDSFRGVTAESIKVGVVAVDLEAIRALVDLDHGSYEAAYRTLIDNVNSNGGVLGRQIELVFESYVPIGTAADEICSRFVDDEEVFVVMGGLLADGPLCYTELSDTAFIGSAQNDSRVERSAAPWFTSTRNIDDSARVILSSFADRGLFDGATLAVVADAALVDQVENVALPLLDDLGVDVVDVDYIEAVIIDEAATDLEVAIMAERQESEGADTILTLLGAGPRYAAGIEDLSYRPRILTTSLGSMRAYIRDRDTRDLSVLDGAVAGNGLEQLGWWEDPAIRECIDLVEAETGTTILDPNTRAPEEPENIVSVAAACRDVSLFVAIAEAAGGDLTNESFAAAGAELGDFHIPGFGLGHYDADNPDGDAPIYLFEWDASIQDLASDGVPIG